MVSLVSDRSTGSTSDLAAYQGWCSKCLMGMSPARRREDMNVETQTPARSTVRFPRILIGALLIVAGILVPALAAPLADPPSGWIGMDHEGYVVGRVDQHEQDEHAGIVPTITLHAGDVISFQNNSRWIHVVGPGDKGLLSRPAWVR